MPAGNYKHGDGKSCISLAHLGRRPLSPAKGAFGVGIVFKARMFHRPRQTQRHHSLGLGSVWGSTGVISGTTWPPARHLDGRPRTGGTHKQCPASPTLRLDPIGAIVSTAPSSVNCQRCLLALLQDAVAVCQCTKHRDYVQSRALLPKNMTLALVSSDNTTSFAPVCIPLSIHPICFPKLYMKKPLVYLQNMSCVIDYIRASLRRIYALVRV
jgi:hypothetical protein